MAAYYRIYYDLTTGEPLATAWARGDIRVPERAEDFDRLTGLAWRTEADTGCWERMEADPELEGLIRSKKPVFDVGQDPPALNWVDWPEPEPEYDEAADMRAALEELGVNVDG